jgi:hypothetical protein
MRISRGTGILMTANLVFILLLVFPVIPAAFGDIRPAPVPAGAKPAATAPATTSAPTGAVQAPPSVTVVPADPALLPPAVRVDGNRLETTDGKAVWLQGLAVASMEWTPAGEHVLRSIQVGIEQWKANAIRLSVRDDFWFGRGKGQKDGGVAYRKLVDAASWFCHRVGCPCSAWGPECITPMNEKGFREGA